MNEWMKKERKWKKERERKKWKRKKERVLTLNPEPHVVAGPAGQVPGGTRVNARVAALARADGQGAVGEDAQVSAVQERPPVSVPRDLRLGLPVGHALQADRLAQHRHVLHPRYAQHRRHCGRNTWATDTGSYVFRDQVNRLHRRISSKGDAVFFFTKRV